jgi:hypothetical protein
MVLRSNEAIIKSIRCGARVESVAGYDVGRGDVEGAYEIAMSEEPQNLGRKSCTQGAGIEMKCRTRCGSEAQCFVFKVP